MKTIKLGDIGKEKKRITLVPLEEPEFSPVEEPAVPEVVPAAEPVPA
jgi:hypothetical protein